MKYPELKIFAGGSHPELALSIAQHVGVKLGNAQSFTFSNDNRFVKLNEPVRGCDVYFVQTSITPVDSYLFETLMFIRTMREASARRITAVLPYFPYVRSDKRDQPRICVTARLIADLLQTAGVNHVLTMDLHSPQTQGFFCVPCDELRGSPLIIHHLQKNWDLTNYVLVAGDSGAVKSLKLYADALQLPVAIMDKRRVDNAEKPVIKGVIGVDVRGKKTLLIDDEVASGKTLIGDAEFLLSAGALSVDASVVHAPLGGNAVENLNNSPIGRFIVTNTIPTNGKQLKNKEEVDVSGVFAECITRLNSNQSIQSLTEA